MLNNLVVLGVLGVYALLPGEITLDPARMSDPKLLLLGLGTTLGIVVQAASLLPAIRRLGVSYRPLFGWDPRLARAGGLALWAVVYVLIGQAGYIVTTRVAADSAVGAVAIYANAWLLLQVPYGVLGVSLLTALMPRMSRAAAEGRNADVVADLSLGSRLLAHLSDPDLGVTHRVRPADRHCSVRAALGQPGRGRRSWARRSRCPRSGCCPTASRCCRRGCSTR